MEFGTFLKIAAVLAFVFGLAFLLVPAQLMSLYGGALGESGQWVGRYLGSAFIGIATLTWLAKSVPQGKGLRAVMLGDFVLSLIGLVVAVLQGLSGTFNALVWTTVAIYAFLTLGFGYFQFVKPPSS